ncbi:cytochrome P450 [Penicillium soppii]|uniref:cytochrome P450 n=1 Tax=Penicillium soppii TaxID=69789 RepID=UPI00254721D3|nr:cytochrome P450 [Penicillium soppii]KAJ5860068.1 cytochrome P450 [Penicillium soppii]
MNHAFHLQSFNQIRPALEMEKYIITLAFIAILHYPFQFFVRSLKCLCAARAMNLPIFWMPILQDGVMWQLTKRFYRPLISQLPLRLRQSEWFDLWYPDWRFVAKHELHKKYGDVFLVVSPGCLSIEVADAELAAEIITRSKYDFVKPNWPYSLLNIFGENVVSSGGATWRRHRKATASQFGSTIHKQVWRKSLILGNELLSMWTNHGATISTVPNISLDLEFLVLRVILSVGFGVTVHLNRKAHESDPPNVGGISRFAEAMEQVITNLTKLLIFPNGILKYGPSSWRSVHGSATGVRTFLENLIWTETRKQKQSLTLTGHYREASNMLTGLVRQGICPSESQKHREKQDLLSDEEVMGNMFILAFAGTNSTADSLKYSLILMALHPDIQQWLIQDIDAAIDYDEDTANPLEWREEILLPKLIAPYCVMACVTPLYRLTTQEGGF